MTTRTFYANKDETLWDRFKAHCEKLNSSMNGRILELVEADIKRGKTAIEMNSVFGQENWNQFLRYCQMAGRDPLEEMQALLKKACSKMVGEAYKRTNKDAKK